MFRREGVRRLFCVSEFGEGRMMNATSGLEKRGFYPRALQTGEMEREMMSFN